MTQISCAAVPLTTASITTIGGPVTSAVVTYHKYNE